jgi:hypothetical protein
LKKFLIFLALGLIAWLWSLASGPIKHPPGILAPHDPVQVEVTDNSASFPIDEWTLRPLAFYRIDARVLSKKRYRFDFPAKLSPYDLLLGWGPMSDSTIVETLSFSQRGRFGLWHWERDPPLSMPEINRHACNIHIIPANDGIQDRIAALRIGTLVRIYGNLVEATHPKAREPWRSSLTRTDEGSGACEILFVKSIEPVSPATLMAGP